VIRLLRSLEVGCWSAGLALGLAYLGPRGLGEWERTQAVAEFHRTAPAASPEPLTAAATPGNARPAPAPDQSLWSAGRIALHAAETAGAGSTPHSRPLALLKIARLGLEVPVYAELNERNLNRGAAHVAGTAPPGAVGNSAIAAHRDGYFRVLQTVAIGDLVELDLGRGSERYRVSALSIVQPTDLSPLDASDTAALTLITCYPFFFVGSAPQRFIVRAERIPPDPGVATDTRVDGALLQIHARSTTP
jgi:LPXTG-site transpeptidase (sortase) family protein